MKRKRIAFRIVQDSDGYPPVSVETVWASTSDDKDEYIVDNVPFFSRDATAGDLVSVIDDGEFLWFDKIKRHSRNSLIRVVFFSPDAMPHVRQKLEEFGCDTEFSKNFGLLAVNIPSRSSLSSVQTYLADEANLGVLDYEEAILRDDDIE